MLDKQQQDSTFAEPGVDAPAGAANELRQHPVAKFVPPMSKAEFAALVEDIRVHGKQEPIIIYDSMVLDGWHGYLACNQLGIQPKFEQYAGDDSAAFVISRNLHRRHLTDDQRSILAAKYERDLAKRSKTARAAKAASARHGKICSEAGAASKQNVRARKAAAQLWNVSENKLRRADALLAENAPLAEEVLAGTKRLDVALDQSGSEKWKAHIAELAQRANLASHEEFEKNFTVLACDFRELTKRLPRVVGAADLVLVDIPYQKPWLNLAPAMSEFAKCVLKPDGIFATMVGRIWLNVLMRDLSKCIPFRWNFAYILPAGKTARIRSRAQANPFFKEVLIFQSGRGKRRFISKDLIYAGPIDQQLKGIHPHAQDVEGFRQMVELLSLPGDLVLDCCCGTGTTGVACLTAPSGLRRFVGCDIKPEYADYARNRVFAEWEKLPKRKPGHDQEASQ